jgi:hypothetical protein
MEGRPVAVNDRLKHMRTRWIFPTAVLLFSLTQATGASAQSGGEDPPATKPAAPAESAVDVSQLPLNLERIQRQLRQSTVRDESDGLRLRYVVDVFGQAPSIELFPNRDYSLTGPAPYGAPTHNDLLQMITPQEHRAPAANFGNLFRWLADKAKDK